MSKLRARILAGAVAVVLGASGLPTGAFAAITPLGTLDPPDASGFFDINGHGAISDTGTFDLLVNDVTTALSVTIAASMSTMYSPGTLTLYEGSPFTGTVVMSEALTYNGSAYTASFTDKLNSGDYYYVVTGTNNVNLLGVGTSVITSSVPEPSTWAMMALGFAGLGYAAFRQRKTQISMLAA